MKRDYAKKHYAKKSSVGANPYARVKLMMIFFALIILLGGIGAGFYYQYHFNTPLFQRMSHFKEDWRDWVAKRQPQLTNLKKKVEKVKQMANKGPEPVHFEFYDELPKMQVRVSEPTTAADGAKSKLSQAANSARIVDADALERELEMQLEKSKRNR